jgi:hypothetical protein
VDARLQVAGLNEPPAPESPHETVPVGEVGDADESVTDAVSAMELLGVVGVVVAGLGDMAVDVGCGGWFTVRDEVPVLVEWVESPE